MRAAATSAGSRMTSDRYSEPRVSAVGTQLTVEETPDGALQTPEPVFPPTAIDDVFGSLDPKGRVPSIGDMDAAIVAEAKRRARD